MIRHIKKFNNAAEMQAAIASGAIAAPYIAFKSDSNIMNMTIPADKEPASIEYEEEEPLWNSPQLVSNMYTADPSNGEYTDASGNFYICYAEDEREGWKYVRDLAFYLNSQYLEGWGSTAETIASETAGGSNTPIVLITEKGQLDAVVEYQENTNGYSESKTLSYLVYDAVNEGREISGSNGVKTITWPCSLSDGSETSFWGEDIHYCKDNVESLEGYYMQPDNNKTPEYYILVAYKKEDEPLKASNENILRAPVDYESMYKVYKAGIFSAYDYSEEEEETPDVSLGYIFTVGQDNTAYFNTGYVPGTNTVVQIKGIMKKSPNGNEHGMATSERGVYQFGIFGFHYPYSNTIYFDHEGYWASCSAELSDVDSATHEYEFGNFYIKVDGTQVATGTPISSTNSNNKEFYIFASNNMDSDAVKGYAPVGASIEYVKFLEPDASGNLQLMADFRPGIIWPDETKVLQDQVSGDIIYPDGLYNAIEATAITVPDSSIDSSADYAYLSNYEDWGQEPMYGYVYPTLYIHREDASMNGFQVGLFATDDTSVGVPAGYNSMDEYYAGMCGDHIIEILGTDSSTALSDLYMDPSIGYTYVGRFVNYEISYDEWENPHYQINDSGTWIILGSYPPPVEATYLSVSGWDPDTENDTCPCVPHLSGDTSYYDMVGFTIIDAASMDVYMDEGGDLENVSPADDPEVCISYFNNAWGVAPDYTCASDSSADLAGTLDDRLPNTGSGTETYYVFAYPVHYDSGNDSYEVYIDTDISGEPQNTPWGWCDIVTWGTEAAAPYTCPNCGVGLDFEPDENNPCPDCNYPLNE